MGGFLVVPKLALAPSRLQTHRRRRGANCVGRGRDALPERRRHGAQVRDLHRLRSLSPAVSRRHSRARALANAACDVHSIAPECKGADVARFVALVLKDFPLLKTVMCGWPSLVEEGSRRMDADAAGWGALRAIGFPGRAAFVTTASAPTACERWRARCRIARRCRRSSARAGDGVCVCWPHRASTLTPWLPACRAAKLCGVWAGVGHTALPVTTSAPTARCR